MSWPLEGFRKSARSISWGERVLNEKAKTSEMRTVRFADGLIQEIELRLASRAPERGGVILGTGSLLHTFIEDDHGHYSGSHWDVSDEVVALCRNLQKKGFGLYAGQIHSHPSGVPDPSGPDRTLMMNALATNPRQPYLVVPILTEGIPRKYDLAVGSRHRLSLMVAVRSSSGPVIERARAVVVPIARDLVSVGFEPIFATSTSDAPSQRSNLAREIEVDGETYIGHFHPTQRRDCLLIPPGYPLAQPLMIQRSSNDGVAIVRSKTWRADDSRTSLSDLTRLTDESSAPVTLPRHREAIPGATARIEPLVGPLGDTRALIGGLGSVGGRIAEDLCRSGVGEFILIDPDEVTPPNLGRSIYSAADLRKYKVDAATQRLRSINPGVIVTGLTKELGKVENLAELVSSADIVVGATDDMEQQELLSHHAYTANRPMVCCALYRRGAAGEVVYSIPEADTPCIYCSLADLDNSVRAEKNYGLGGRLAAEPALGPSIQLVASFASIVVLGILAGPHSEAGRSLIGLIQSGKTYGKISTTPNWDFFPKVFGDMGHQHAPQSVWIKSQRRLGCYACGEERRPPVDRTSGLKLAEYLSTEGITSTEPQLQTELD